MPGDIRLSSTAGPVASGDHDCYVPGLPHVVLNLSAEDAAAGVGTVIAADCFFAWRSRPLLSRPAMRMVPSRRAISLPL